MFFFDAIDDGFIFRAKLKFAKKIPASVSKLLTCTFAALLKHAVLLIVSVGLYYADLAKDILIAVQFMQKVLGQSGLSR